MIPTIFLNLVSNILSYFAGLLPSTELPAWIGSSVSYVSYALNSFSYILPVGTIITVLIFVVGFEAIVWGWHGLLWLFKKIPFIGK